MFNQYTATGELDLPEENDEEDPSEEERDLEGGSGDDSELDEYYRELGIEPSEMKQSKKEDAVYKKKKKEVKKPKPQSKKSEVLEKMITKARDSPSA